MIFEYCPLTEELHKYRRKKIIEEFPVLKRCSHDYYLSLWKYLNHIPEKCYSKKASKDIFEFLIDLQKREPQKLINILIDSEVSLALAFRILNEINSLKFHDSELPSDEYDLMQFCDNNIHPSYLKLTEGAYSNLILPISIYQRIRRNAKLDGFDLYNRVEELKNTQYSYLSKPYNQTIRNAIAHGKVIYKQLDIIYQDKRNSVDISAHYAVSLFDNMIDICNGLALGFTLFYLKNLEIFEKYNITIPHPIMIEELKAQTDAPGWVIIGCLESETIHKESQLIIFSKNNFLNTNKLRYHFFRSAILAEKFSPGYGRYFLKSNSKYSLFGWAGFDGKELNKIRSKKNAKIEDYVTALNERTVYFIPKIKLPRFVFKISNLISAIKIIVPIKWLEFKDEISQISIDPRFTEIYRNKFHSIIKGRAIIKTTKNISFDDLIRNYYKKIAKKIIKSARKKAKVTTRYLPLGYLKIIVFLRDFRIRTLKSAGFIPEVLCIIELKKLKRIRTINYIDGTSEVVKDFRIVWNNKVNIES